MNQSPDLLLAEGFARHAADWATRQGASPATADAVRRAAIALSLAVSDGHVCIGLAAIAREPDEHGTRRGTADWRAVLRASGVVGGVDDPGTKPLVLDDQDRLYLHRYLDYERRLARRLTLARRAPPDAAASSPELRARLAELFAPNAARLDGAADWQQLAAALALRGRLTVISGGPGTGKTSTVVNLLACLLALDPDCRIALAAPTGKAAARMTDAIRQRAAHLPETLRTRMPTDASTVHRLLGVTGASGGFVHHAGDPLAIDALVVDEASMLDLALATQLLEAVPPGARLILLGDKHQLAAVESGAVFAELSADPSLSDECRRDLAAMTGTPVAAITPPLAETASVLHDVAVWFTQTYRFASDSGIGRLARRVNGGDAAGAIAWLRRKDPATDTDTYTGIRTGITMSLFDAEATDVVAESTPIRSDTGSDVREDVAWLVDDATPPLPASAAHCMADGYAAYREAVARAPGDVAAITEAFGRFRVLCAVREGPRGVEALNDDLSRRFRSASRATGPEEAAGHSPWFAGRPVLVLNNDYVLRLFNGDVGIALPDAEGRLLVHFPDAASDTGFRAVAPVRLPRHETAFAMTVHKSQGSEFDAVLVILPQRRSRVATRELLYTAITRARRHVTLLADEEVLAASIATSTQRDSGLLTRLAECEAAWDRHLPAPSVGNQPDDS